MFSPKFTRLIDGFALFGFALSDLSLNGKVKVSIDGSLYSWNDKTQELEVNLERVKLQVLRDVIATLPSVTVLKCDEGDVLVKFDQNSGKFEYLDHEEVAENHVYQLFPGLSPNTQESVSELLEVKEETSQVVDATENLALPLSDNSSDTTQATIELDHLSLFIATRNTEKKLLKKKIEFSYELGELIKGWLTVNKHSHKLLKKTEHNALVLYPYPAYEFIIQMVKGVPQVRKRPIISENGQELRNRSRSIILKSGRAPIPEVSNLLQICPIKEEVGGEIYITQTYIFRDTKGSYTRKANRIAWFDKDGGSLVYYTDIESNYKQKVTHIETTHQKEVLRELTNSDPVVVKHLIQPLLEVGGDIYPDLSIKEIKLENLVPDAVMWDREDESRQFWVNEIENLYISNTNERVVKKPDQLKSASKFKKIAGNSSAFSPRSVIPSITFLGIPHPNIEETKIPQHTKLISNKLKPYLLDGSKAVSGQMMFKGVLGTVPCILKMSPSGRLYDIQALPIKVNQYALAIYVVGHNSKILATTYLERTIAKYQKMNVNIDKLREKNELITKLETLLRNLNQGIKPDAADILDASTTIEKYLDRANYNPITGDSYYRYHSLGTGQFIQQVNTERYQYLVTDYGKNFRKGAGSDVSSVINWVRNCPRNLNERFGHKSADINEIQEYLEKSFSDRFSKNLQLAVYERGQKFLEIYYKGGLEIKQQISIVSPSTPDKKTNMISTNTNFKPEWATDNEFSQFLQCSEINESALIKATREQASVMVKKYVRSNYLELTGKNKVFKETKIVQLVGFDKSNARYGDVVKTFLKYLRPYLDQSASNVLKGELISLDTLKTYSEQNARELIGAITNNWKNWKHKDLETIKLGECTIKKPDPGVLMLAVNAAISQNPHHDKIIWRDLIDIFYQLSELSLGFRAFNGCILTPHSFYDSGVTRHTHRIKLQLIDLLLKEQRRKQQTANDNLVKASTPDQKAKAMEEIELTKRTYTGSIEAWMGLSIKRLYDALEQFDPQWELNLANEDIMTHLMEMENALTLAINARDTDN